MENPTQIRKRVRDESKKTTATTLKKSPSKIQVVKVVLKLLPFIINFRKDRREWVRREGKNVNEKKYRKHAERALRAFIDWVPPILN